MSPQGIQREITDAVLDQWERSARADAEVESTWATNPLVLLAVIRDLRNARAALARVEALCDDPVLATWVYGPGHSDEGMQGEANAVQVWRIRTALLARRPAGR